MKTRTIEEIHDKYVGHRKFAWFVDFAIENGYTIEDIKEYNEKFKFLMNGWALEFDKSPKVNAKWQYQMSCELIANGEKLKRLMK